VQTHQIKISNGRERVDAIRGELFAFPEVLEVFVTSRPDALVVVCAGRPHPGEWLRALRASGFGSPAPRPVAVDDGERPDPFERPLPVAELRSAA